MTRSSLAGTLLALGLALAAPFASARADESDWRTDDEGRRFRVAFDPGSRVLLGSSWDGGTTEGGLGFELGFLIRDRDDVGVQWKLDHEITSGRIGVDGDVQAVLYRGLYLRWSPDGSLTIPTVPPATMRVPFDLGFELAFGRVHRRDGVLRVGAVQADILFDFWRCHALGSWLALRTGVAYDLEADDALTITATHIVTPFSRVGLDFRHDFDSGRQSLALAAALSHRTYVQGTAQRWSNDAEASAAWEVILLALNDQPLSLRAEGSWTWREAPPPGAPEHDLRGTIALRLSFPND